MTDEVRLKQVLINLLNNAFKFTEEGFVKLNINLTNEKNKMLTRIYGLSFESKEELESKIAGCCRESVISGVPTVLKFDTFIFGFSSSE